MGDNFWIIAGIGIFIVVVLRIWEIVRQVKYNRKRSFIANQLYKRLKGEGRSSDGAPAEKKLYDYRVYKPLFTPGEYQFYEVLKDVVGDKALIFGQVRVSDIVNPVRGLSSSDRQCALNRIHMKHFDFVLCDKKDSRVLCVIELNDETHKRKDRRERDEFLKHVCDSAGLKLFSTKTKSSYPKDVLRDALKPYIDSN